MTYIKILTVNMVKVTGSYYNLKAYLRKLTDKLDDPVVFLRN